jgi:hypothetical protein
MAVRTAFLAASFSNPSLATSTFLSADGIYPESAFLIVARTAKGESGARTGGVPVLLGVFVDPDGDMTPNNCLSEDDGSRVGLLDPKFACDVDAPGVDLFSGITPFVLTFDVEAGA